jgi:hypothetical protein
LNDAARWISVFAASQARNRVNDLKPDLKTGLCAALFLLLWSLSLNAQETTDEHEEPDKATERENPASRIPYETGKEPAPACEDRWSSFLPIWGRAACERGYVLPRPFGVSVGFMHQDQPFDVGDIFINGINVTTPNIAIVDEVQNEESTYTLRFDAWILPFWNVYGILGRTDGQAVGPLEVNLDPLFPFICSLPGNDCQINSTFEINYKADVVGFGTTIAGGYKDFFGMVDINRTKADLDISLTDADATVISARIGWNGKLGGFTGVLWLGAMYQDIAQTLDLPVDIGDRDLLVSIEQETAEAVNYLIGGQWDINRSFSVLAELGFGERESQMLSVTYRF